MICRHCGYDFDPTLGLQCPRCGEPFDCEAVSCGECGGCTGAFGLLGRRIRRSRSGED